MNLNLDRFIHFSVWLFFYLFLFFTEFVGGGGNGKITRADVIHDDLFIECKLRAKHTVVSLWDDTAKLAKEEGKTPVIALCEKNRPGFWVMIHSSDLNKIKEIK